MPDFIKGDVIILSVHDGTIYRPLAWLTSNSLSETRNIIESQTKCDPGVIIKGGGSYSYELSAEGRYIDTTSAGAAVTLASHDWMHTNGIGVATAVTWRMSTGLTDTPYYYGTAIFSDLEATADAGDEFANWSATMSGSGAIVTVDPIP